MISVNPVQWVGCLKHTSMTEARQASTRKDNYQLTCLLLGIKGEMGDRGKGLLLRVLQFVLHFFRIETLIHISFDPKGPQGLKGLKVCESHRIADDHKLS